MMTLDEVLEAAGPSPFVPPGGRDYERENRIRLMVLAQMSQGEVPIRVENGAVLFERMEKVA